MRVARNSWTRGSLALLTAAALSLPTLGATHASLAKSESTNPTESSKQTIDRKFTIDALKQGAYREIEPGDVGASRRAEASLEHHKLKLVRIGNDAALVDATLARSGMAVATRENSIELSWVPETGAGGYLVSRDGGLIARLSGDAAYFKDTSVLPGRTYNYVVSATEGSSAERSWGLSAATPTLERSESTEAALFRTATDQVALAAYANKTILSWITFIAPSRINAPRYGCDYGRGYAFGGDGHGFDWTTSKYRTAAHAVIHWSTKGVTGRVAVGPTRVYRKSTGARVATRRASASSMRSYKLGSGSNYVDIRMVTHARNPFCRGGAIDGAITIQVSKNGWWAIRSGNHRKMPHHHMYTYNHRTGGTVTNIYMKKAQSVWCLVGAAACDLATLTGFTGDYS